MGKIKILAEGSVIKHKKFEDGKTEMTIESLRTNGDAVTYYCAAVGKPGIIAVPADKDVEVVTDASAEVADESSEDESSEDESSEDESSEGTETEDESSEGTETEGGEENKPKHQNRNNRNNRNSNRV